MPTISRFGDNVLLPAAGFAPAFAQVGVWSGWNAAKIADETPDFAGRYGNTNTVGAAHNDGRGVEIIFNTAVAIKAFKFYGYKNVCDALVEYWDGLAWVEVTVIELSTPKQDNVYGDGGVIGSFNNDGEIESTTWRWQTVNYVDYSQVSNFYAYELEAYTQLYIPSPKDHIAHYKMDTVAGSVLVDEIGDNNGTISGASKVTGNALSFDGVDDKVDFGNVGAFKTPQGSTSLWVKVPGTGESTWGFNQRKQGAFNNYMCLLILAGGLPVILYRSNIITYTELRGNAVSLPHGSWAHYVLMSDGFVNSLYVNGVQVVLTNQTGEINSGRWFDDFPLADEFSLGTLDSSDFRAGVVDELRIYDRALTSSEVVGLYEEDLLNVGLQTNYTMDNISGANLIDEQGNHNAAIVNALQGLGHLGSSLDFNGVDTYAELGVASKSDFKFIHNDLEFGISLWVKLNSAGEPGFETFLASGGTAADKGFLFSFGGDTNLYFSLYAGGSASDHNVAGYPTDTEWHNYVVTGDGTNIKFYVDAVQLGVTGTVAPAVGDSTHEIQIGRYVFGGSKTPGGYLDAKLDQLRIYNKHLSQSDLEVLYFERVLDKIITGTITETLAVQDWVVNAHRLDNGLLTATLTTVAGSFELVVNMFDDVPHYVTVIPVQGSTRENLKTYIISEMMYPPDPATTPYYYKVTIAGVTGSTEPVYTTVPGTTFVDGTVTWECVERLVRPRCHSPMIPQ